MHDLPPQTQLQQSAAHPMSGEELEVLGKRASAMYRCGGCTLNDAVVETVKKAGLSPEQVKRVVEFANTDAYLKEFEKKGATHKYIDFHGGPANPSEILKDLNDGGGGTVFDTGSGDYMSPPLQKTSAALYAVNMEAMEKVALQAAPQQQQSSGPGVGTALGVGAAGAGIGGVVGGHLGARKGGRIAQSFEQMATSGGGRPGTQAIQDFARSAGARKPLGTDEVQALRGAARDYMHLNPAERQGVGRVMKGTFGGIGAVKGIGAGLLGAGALYGGYRLLKGNQNKQASASPVDEYLAGRREEVHFSSNPPEEKVAQVDYNPAERAFEQMWAVDEKPLPYANPLEDAIDLREKLATVDDELRYGLNSAELFHEEVLEDLYQGVKQAAAEGVPLGHVIQAWHAVGPAAGMVKSAFSHIGDRLVREGIFETLDELGGSLEKTAGRYAAVDTSHPLVGAFAAYCQNLEKMAGLRRQRAEVGEGLEYITDFLKEAGKGGALGGVWRGAKALGEKIAPTVGKAGRAVAGETAGRGLEAAARWAPRAALLGGGYLGAQEVYDRAVKFGPLAPVGGFLKARVPGTQNYYMRQMALAQNPGLF